MKDKIDIEITGALTAEIADRIKLIKDMLPHNEDTNILLKNLASACIHLLMFLSDVQNFITDEKENEEIIKILKRFTEVCGCPL